MHREHTVTHRNYCEHTGAHMSARERRIFSDKGHTEQPTNARTSTHLTSAVVVAAVLFFVLLPWILFE